MNVVSVAVTDMIKIDTAIVIVTHLIGADYVVMKPNVLL